MLCLPLPAALASMFWVRVWSTRYLAVTGARCAVAAVASPASAAAAKNRATIVSPRGARSSAALRTRSGGPRWSSRKPSSVPGTRAPGMVICLGWPSPATSSSLPAACPVGVGHTSPLIWPCSDWGLPCRRCCQRRGGLLPHRFTLTHGCPVGGLFSVALSVAFRRPGVTWQSTRWSSDFPRSALRRPRPSRSTSGGNITGDGQAGRRWAGGG